MRSYELITQEEFLNTYTDWHVSHASLNYKYGRRYINIISKSRLEGTSTLAVLNDLDQIFGLEEIFKHDILINCVVNE